MPETYDVYAHRGKDGFAFASIPSHTVGFDDELERIESKIFAKYDDELGPHPTDPNCENIQEVMDSPFPLERRRKPQNRFKVGEITVEDGEITTIEIFDDIEELTWARWDPCWVCGNDDIYKVWYEMVTYLSIDDEGHEHYDTDEAGEDIKVECEECGTTLWEAE